MPSFYLLGFVASISNPVSFGTKGGLRPAKSPRMNTITEIRYAKDYKFLQKMPGRTIGADSDLDRGPSPPSGRRSLASIVYLLALDISGCCWNHLRTCPRGYALRWIGRLPEDCDAGR